MDSCICVYMCYSFEYIVKSSALQETYIDIFSTYQECLLEIQSISQECLVVDISFLPFTFLVFPIPPHILKALVW